MSRTRLLTLPLCILIAFTLTLGCNNNPFQPKVLKVTPVPYTNYAPTLCWELAMEKKDSLPTPTPTPGPSPNPSVKVGDTCPVCLGRGKSGDGINPCDPCKGDGKVNEGDPILFSSLEYTATKL